MAKLGERKNGQVQATLKIRSCQNCQKSLKNGRQRAVEIRPQILVEFRSIWSKLDP
jgi:RNase P subunit RPR2